MVETAHRVGHNDLSAVKNDVFLPATISEKGFLLAPIPPQYMGFRIEIISTTDSASFYTNTFVGVEPILIEKAMRENATFYKGETFAVADAYVLQVLCEEWLQSTRVMPCIFSQKETWSKKYT